jgi:hypothetical protein
MHTEPIALGAQHTANHSETRTRYRGLQTLQEALTEAELSLKMTFGFLGFGKMASITMRVVSLSVAKLWWKITPKRPENVAPRKAAA